MGLLFPILVLAGFLGCAAPLIFPINANDPIELAPNGALLIIHIDTDIALKNLVLNNSSVVQSLGKGRHIWMVRVREGRYRWKQVEIGNQPRNRMKYLLESDDELSFDVEAGKINYPGELMIRSDTLSRWGVGTLIVRNRNHSAMAIRELRDPYGPLLRAFPLHYAGLSGDGFLEYYMKQRERPSVESNGASRRRDQVGEQSEAP